MTASTARGATSNGRYRVARETVLSVTAARDGRTEELAGEVVEAARQLWRVVGAEKPTAAPAVFEKLRPRHIQLLRLLASQPGMSVRQAAEALSMRPHNLSTLITDLVGAGLVERRGDPHDRRVARLYLSETARAEVEGVERDLHTAVVEVLARLTDVDQGRIRAALPALARLVTSLENPAPLTGAR
ncbi:MULTISPECIES: MarR family winged helix-turn-helix transcriptional regulator [unclassified Pseudofrankia]|uniref:MarR family winged helix-turn-helix transcriptional regulator n=1 Tax=unclassified Pseudofrankia TaxID=2994372 RepID=UPI0009F73953|nr:MULTISPECIES: MarR family transcriptional regulator [unclassified Pseudofrankia]MDT3440255.1 MarR family transcriptional regulator [Pseudofrankia sp. BMG5.37]